MAADILPFSTAYLLRAWRGQNVTSSIPSPAHRYFSQKLPFATGERDGEAKWIKQWYLDRLNGINQTREENKPETSARQYVGARRLYQWRHWCPDVGVNKKQKIQEEGWFYNCLHIPWPSSHRKWSLISLPLIMDQPQELTCAISNAAQVTLLWLSFCLAHSWDTYLWSPEPP